MWVLIGVFVFFFTAVSFFQAPVVGVSNPGLNYVLSYIAFFSEYFVITVLCFFVILVIFFKANFDKRISPIKIFFFATMQSIAVVLIGFAGAFIILCVTAFLQLTVFSLLVQNKPEFLGIQTTNQSIVTRLAYQKGNISLFLADEDQKKIVVSLAKIASGTTNLYGNVFLSAVPTVMIFPVEQQQPMVLLDNAVIVTKSDQKTFSETGAILGYWLVKDYFPRRTIKSFPEISFMTTTEYGQFRQDDAQEKIEMIDGQLAKIDSYVSSLSAQMEIDIRQRRNLIKIRDEYLAYDEYFTRQRDKLLETTNHIPNELGVFKSPDSIKLIYSDTYDKDAIHYFATLVHEYLHYASYQSEERRLSSVFFEEALTEYFARRIIESEFGRSTNVGYPLQERILSEMMKMYTDNELADIYFTKDENALRHAINRVYGDNFYENNFVMFETMMYTSDPAQKLSLANTIMKKLGNKQLTEKDLRSSYSD